jgi:nicotinate-nucleotide adenylyltransferase
VRLGILGGTFDPIHAGHLAAARAAMECEHLDRVVFVPTGVPPHRGGAVASAEQRLEMCSLAIGDDTRFVVSDLEVKRAGPSYTVDTLRELERLHPDDRLFLILGWDAAQLFNTWHEPAEIRTLASVIVVTRPGSGPWTGMGLEVAGLGNGSTTVCERPTPAISGSALRRKLGEGKPVADMLPEAVEHYIAKHGLYGHNR